jgi:hypothetical protein
MAAGMTSMLAADYARAMYGGALQRSTAAGRARGAVTEAPACCIEGCGQADFAASLQDPLKPWPTRMDHRLIGAEERHGKLLAGHLEIQKAARRQVDFAATAGPRHEPGDVGAAPRFDGFQAGSGQGSRPCFLGELGLGHCQSPQAQARRFVPKTANLDRTCVRRAGGESRPVAT